MNISILEPGYLSLRPGLRWNDIPKYAVLSGPNGSGKSQLLAAISQDYSITAKAKPTQLTRVDGVSLTHGDILYATSDVQVQSYEVSSSRVTQAVAEVSSQLTTKNLRSHQNEDTFFHERRAQRMRAQLATVTGRDIAELEASEINDALPYNFGLSTNHETRILSSDLSLVFYTYELRVRERIVDHKESRIEAETFFGEPPWMTLNELLLGFGLPFQCTQPKGGIFSTYTLAIVNSVSGATIRLDSLSSGEKTLLRMAMWILAYRMGSMPKLILLDEPDAHLHASMIPRFVNAITSTLVSKLGIRVIIATHRAETILQSPDDSIFELKATSTEVRPTTKRSIVRTLTSDAYTILPSTRCVIVEDGDDARFYTMICQILALDSQLSESVHLVFQPASTRTSSTPITGGRSVVKSWVQKLSSSGLDGIVYGLIDHDNRPENSAIVLQIGRYSIENYLLDPLVVYATLIEFDRAPIAVPPGYVRRGFEGHLRSLDPSVLQQIVGAVLDPVRPKLGSADESPVRVAYGSTELEYPQWLISTRGKDLLRSFQDAFNCPDVINISNLMSSFNRVSMVPTELATLLERICCE